MSTVIAILALVVSVVLAALRIWEALFVKPRLDAKIDWIQTGGRPVLRFVLANVGRRKDAVSDIRFRQADMPEGRGWTPFAAVFQHLPFVLDVNEASRAFYIHVGTPHRSTERRGNDLFTRKLREDDIRVMEVEMISGTRYAFELPSLLSAERKWQSSEELPIVADELQGPS